MFRQQSSAPVCLSAGVCVCVCMLLGCGVGICRRDSWGGASACGLCGFAAAGVVAICGCLGGCNPPAGPLHPATPPQGQIFALKGTKCRLTRPYWSLQSACMFMLLLIPATSDVHLTPSPVPTPECLILTLTGCMQQGQQQATNNIGSRFIASAYELPLHCLLEMFIVHAS